MNKLIIFCLSFFLIACNNSGAPSAADNNSSDTMTNKKKNDVAAKPAATGSCGRLIFFQPGAEIEASSYNEAGEEVAKQHTKILEVKNESGMTVAYVEGSDVQAGDGKTTNVKYNYKCDGSKIYFDVASMFRTEQKSRDDAFEASLIEYPINLTEGEMLPDATGTMSSERNGRKMEIRYHYKNRKVEGNEEVTTPAGTWNCYKISHSVEAEMNFPGMDEKTKQMMQAMQGNMKTTSITWFSPDFGIVKMEMYMNGKLQSRNEVTAVKK
jgi:hypothetical protein